MFGLLLRAAKAAGKAIKQQIKYASKVIKNPVKAIATSLSKEGWKRRFRRNKILKRAVRKNKVVANDLSQSAKKTNAPSKPKSSKKTGSAEPSITSDKTRIGVISEIVEKAGLIEVMLNDVSEMLRGKSSAKVNVSSYIKDINNNRDILKVKSDSELDNLKKMLNKELEDLNIKTDDVSQYANDKKKYYKTVKLNSFETYMDNWKTRFFDSDTTEHLSDDEKQEIWGEIEQTWTYSKFLDVKVDR